MTDPQGMLSTIRRAANGPTSMSSHRFLLIAWLRNRAALCLGLALIPSSMAYESAFPPTEPGVNELKTLPAGILLKSSTSGSYFDQSGALFRPLFRYISDHDISMTVPVEASIDEAAMYFWIAENEKSKVTDDSDSVEVIEIPERFVASRGAKGGYSRENFEEARDELLAWLETRTDLQITGEPYAVYWNGPFTLWFLKQFEVHLPVRQVPPETSPATG